MHHAAALPAPTLLALVPAPRSVPSTLQALAAEVVVNFSKRLKPLGAWARAGLLCCYVCLELLLAGYHQNVVDLSTCFYNNVVDHSTAHALKSLTSQVCSRATYLKPSSMHAHA